MKMSRIIIAEKAEQCHNVTRGVTVGINCSKTTVLLNNTVREYIEVLRVRFPSFHGRAMVFSHCTGLGMELESVGST